MKRQKLKENCPEGQNKTTEKTWKIKCKEKSVVIKQLNKRNTELKTSRDLWKSKYQAGELSAEKTVALESPKARHHQYSVHVEMLVMHLQNYVKMSLRSCCHSVSSLWEIQTKNLSQYSP